MKEVSEMSKEELIQAINEVDCITPQEADDIVKTHDRVSATSDELKSLRRELYLRRYFSTFIRYQATRGARRFTLLLDKEACQFVYVLGLDFGYHTVKALWLFFLENAKVRKSLAYWLRQQGYEIIYTKSEFTVVW